MRYRDIWLDTSIRKYIQKQIKHVNTAKKMAVDTNCVIHFYILILSVRDGGYSRNVSCALISVSTIFFYFGGNRYSAVSLLTFYRMLSHNCNSLFNHCR
jgi:hypothetical protein